MSRPIYLRLSPYPIFLLFAAILSVFILFGDAKKNQSDFVFTTAKQPAAQIAHFTSGFVCHPCVGPQVHSASVVIDSDGDLLAVWFGGSREGAGDVRIFESRLASGSSRWSPEQILLDRQKVSADLNRYIKKLGNPVLGRSEDGRLWLFFVTVSAGGWSGSSVNYMVSADNGKTWSDSRRLITTPFFNVSTLVHGVPLIHSNGTLSVPVYHELIGKFSELLQISKDGKVLAKQRISSGKQSFQPAATAISGSEAVLLARSASPSDRHIFISSTRDAGKTWTAPVPTNLPNPDSGIAVVSGADKSLLVVYNDSQTDRGNLALAISRDQGKTWRRIHYFEHEEVPHSGEEYSYPTIIRSGDQYHLVYTWRREGIRYVSFNTAWVRQQERQ